jgi:flavin reductase (DIM6/NTAB) family NADH-FMN oxidoreductase RutF
MKNYVNISNEKAYHLLNTGALILVSSRSKLNDYNIAPIAWNSPVDYGKTTKLLFVIDTAHKTYENIIETKELIVSIPHASQLKLIKELGNYSGRDINKFNQFGINTRNGKKVDCKAPENCIGYIECKLLKVIEEDSVGIVICEALNTVVDHDAYTGRLLSEKTEGKTIHHLGGNMFITFSDELLDINKNFDLE